MKEGDRQREKRRYVTEKKGGVLHIVIRLC
jgi:hypothetical protein